MAEPRAAAAAAPRMASRPSASTAAMPRQSSLLRSVALLALLLALHPSSAPRTASQPALLYWLPSLGSAAGWHFAFGSMSWIANATNATHSSYVVTFQQGWNSSWHWCSSGLITSPKGCASASIAVGNVITTIGGGSGNQFSVLDQGPAVRAGSNNNVNNYKSALTSSIAVASMYPLDVVFTGTASFVVGPFAKTEKYNLMFAMCCRVDYLYGANSGGNLYAYITTAIRPGLAYTFNTTNPPRTYAYVNEPVPFRVQVSALSVGQTVNYTFSPPGVSGLAVAVPANMTLNSTTGVVSWTTGFVGVFAVQFMITDTATGAYVVLDTLIQTFPSTAHPVFAALPGSWQFAVSVEGVYTVSVSESDSSRTLTVTAAGGPTAASFSLLSTTRTNGSVSAMYAFRWTPGADDYSSTVCFQAYDDRGFFNSGNACVTLVVTTGNLLVLSGTVRDFHDASSRYVLSPDFSNAAGGDTTQQFVQTAIASGATHRIPQFNSSVATTTTSAAAFAQWWNTDPAGLLSVDQSFFVLLSNVSSAAVGGDSRVYTYSTSAFWPIDNQLFGNEAGAHNRYFTWEAHTYLTYTGGEQLLFKSADDLWVFINGQLPAGWNMQGISGSQRSFLLSLDSMFNSTTNKATTYAVDIFYAHRSSQHDASLQIQLVAASLCNALSTGVSEISFGFPPGSSAASPTAVATSVWLYGQSSLSLLPSGQSVIALMPNNSAFSTSVAYFGDASGPLRLKIAHGFRCQFSFVGGGATDGFTFIMHADSPYVLGGAGGNLGYAGSTGIKRSIAVEFDGLVTNGNGDPSWNHVSVHSQWAAANSAVEPGLGGLYSAATPPLTWFNGSRFDVTVLYTAPVEGSGQQTGEMQITIAGYNTPILVAPINATMLTAIWEGSAYVGFTAGSGSSTYNSITISNVSLIAIPASAVDSYVPAGGSPSPSSSCVAGQLVSMVVQLRDSCNNDLTIGGDANDLSAALIFVSPLPYSTQWTTVATVAGTVTDNDDGTYNFTFTPTLAGQYYTQVLYAGAPIGTSPYNYTVYPTGSSAAMSFFNLSIAPAPAGGGSPQIDVNALLLNITTRDQYGNRVYWGKDTYSISFAPDVLSTASYPQPVWDTAQLVYHANVTANLAVSSQLYIALASADLSSVNVIGSAGDVQIHLPFSVTFLPGPASAATSSLQAAASLSGATAGVAGTFGLFLRDASGNLISMQEPTDAACQNPASSPVWSTCYMQSVSNTALSYPILCQWSSSLPGMQCSYVATVAGVYQLVIAVNQGLVTSIASNLTVVAGPVDPQHCQLSVYTAASSSQAASSPLNITAGSIVTLSVKTFDAYGNAQSSGLSAGVVSTSYPATGSFVATLSSSAVVSVSVTAFSASNGLSVYSSQLVLTAAGSYVVAVSLNGVNVSGVPFSITVQPGAASSLSYVASPPGVPSPLVAGTVGPFDMVSVDSSGNLRSLGGSGGDYLVQVSGVSNTSVVSVPSSANSHFPVVWSSTAAGNYSLSIQLSASGANIVGSPFAVSVLPDATYPPACTASGDGYVEGITGSTAAFLIYAADAYGNAQWPWLHRDYFLIAIAPLGGSSVSYFYANVSLASAASTVNGVYQVSYTVPSLTTSVTQYNISVLAISSGGSQQPIGTAPSTATILPANTSLIAVVSGPDFPSAQIGRVNTWYVVDLSGTTQSATLAVLIYSEDLSVQYSVTAYAQQPSGSSNYTLSFTPSFRLPLSQSGTPQLFFVNVSRVGLLSTAAQPNATFSAGQPAALNCNVSLSYPSPLPVNSSVVVQAQLFDAFSNRITGQLTSSQLLNATMVCSSTPPTGATGSSQLSAAAQWQSAAQLYQFVFQPRVACTYSLQVHYQSALLGGRSFSLTTVPGAVSAAVSVVQTANVSVVGGTPFSVSVALRDAFGNPVDPSLAVSAPNSSLAIRVADRASVSPNASFVSASVYSGQLGIYSIQVTPYAANNATSAYWPIAVTLGSQPLLGSPVRLTVAAAAITTSVLSAPSIIAAGQPWVVQLSLFDQYGNPASLASSPLPLTALLANPSLASYSTPLGSQSADAAFIANSASAAYQYRYSFNATYTAGSYNFSLQSSGVLVASTSLAVSVVAEQVFVPNTIVPSVLPASVAGAPNSLLLTLRDSYGNVISNSSHGASIGLQAWSWSGTFTCDPDLWTDDTVMPELVVPSTPLQPSAVSVLPAVFLPSTAQFLVQYTVYVAARVTINVTFGGVPLPCLLLLPALAQTISPAQPSAATSQLMDVPSRSTAGSSITLYVDLYDQYGNVVWPGTYNVSVPNALSQLAASLPAGSLSDPTSWLPASLSSNKSDAAGRYTLIAQPTLAKLWTAVVALNGVPIRAVSANSSIAASWAASPTFPVIPASPTVVSAYSVPGSLQAALPFSLLISLSDAYSNFLSADNPWYPAAVTVRGQTAIPSSYTFNGSSQRVSGAGSASQNNASVQSGLQGSVVLQWTATSVWSGPATIQLSLTTNLSTYSSAVSVFVSAAMCAVNQPTAPYRCPDGSCAASYDQCATNANGGDYTCPSVAPFQCAVDGSCASAAWQCPCPFNLTRCNLSLVCVADLTTDCFPPFTGCPAGTESCRAADGLTATGQCRFALSACPSPAVCPPGYALCADLYTCAATASLCSDYASLNGSAAWSDVTSFAAAQPGTFRCWDGTFVSQLSDCSTPKTCAAGYKLCLTDQSCQPSAAQCPPPFTCPDPAVPFRCANGQCRSSASDCPASVTCPVGYLRCDNDGCVTDLAECLPAYNCSSQQTRCADGSCQPNLALCAASLTCPLSAPVQCSDGSCVASAAYCVIPSPCPASRRGVLCPDGSCAQSGAACPTGFACPDRSPVLCSDSVTCAAKVSSCPVVQRCLAPNVVRCPDGSCRRQTADCPTAASCPANQPVRCGDGSCSYSSALCPTAASCPASAPIRCGGGECVLSSTLCPTHVTCTAGTSRCADGSCRFACPATVELTCAAGSISCPQASAGVQCAANLTACPQQAICPSSAPVRCIDTSCATSLSACPALLADPPTSLLPCPDGSWTADVTTCGTLVSCPAAFPFKCLDETCRLSPGDCPLLAACSNSSASSASQYRCPNGACVSALTDAQCQTNTRVACPASRPYKCVGAGEVCVAAQSLCPLPSFYSQQVPSVSSAGTLTAPNNCPTGFLACRDGSCVSDVSACPSSAICPVYLPSLCPSGVCAANASSCPDPVTGCYPLSARPHACWNGACVGSVAECPSSVPSNCVNYCMDGSCPPVSLTSPAAAASWCTVNGHNCAINCADRTCGLMPTDPTATNLCVAGGVLSGFGSPLHPDLGNVCPTWSPHRCDDGLCVASALNCTALPDFHYCAQVNAGTTPYQCANGDCVVSAIQCPVLYACPVGADRCGDGTCRLSGTCPAYGNTCPTFEPKTTPLPDGSNRRPRCTNGLCAPGSDITSCVDLTTGCPSSAPQRCPNGACVPGTDGSACTNVTLSTANGCPASAPSKCQNGQCVASADSCPLANGCPMSAPYRCTAGDGTCQSAASDCLLAAHSAGCSGEAARCVDGSCPAPSSGFCAAANGCPMLAPWRCASGECKKYPATAMSSFGISAADMCPLVVTCPASQSLCYDGSCAADRSLCPAVPLTCAGTPAAPVLCADLSCAASQSACPTSTTRSLAASCPTAVPIACDSGACVSSKDQCYIYGVPGVSAGGLQPFTLNNGAAHSSSVNSTSPSSLQSALALHTGNATAASASALCPPSLPYACFDGSCRQSWSECQQWTILAYGRADSTAALNASLVDVLSSTLCLAAAEVLCPNGYCAPATCNKTDFGCVERGCGVVAACDQLTAPIRCPDGSCANSSSLCPSMPACPALHLAGYAPLSQMRCEDGACRLRCLPVDGCSLAAPYYCRNRECVNAAGDCLAAAVGGMFAFDAQTDLEQPVELATTARSASTINLRVIIAAQQQHQQQPRSSLAALSVSSLSSGTGSSSSESASSSSSTVDTSDLSAPLSVGASLSCWSGCWSQVSAVSVTQQVDPRLSTTLSLLSTGYSLTDSTLTIPANALLFSVAASASVNSTAAVSIAPVAESRLRGAENRIPASRQAEYGCAYLTYAETVLSTPFQLSVDSTVAVPFALGLQVHASADLVQLPASSSTASPSIASSFDYGEVCLGELVEYPVFGLSYWRCVLVDVPARSASPVYDSSRDAGLSASVLTGYVTEPGVYAFIRSPLPGSQAGAGESFIAHNLLIIVLCLAGGVAFLAAVLYVFKRLHRYRAKYHQERRDVAVKREEVEEMEMFGGAAGRKDEEVVMTANPLKLQLQDLTMQQAKGLSGATADSEPAVQATTAAAAGGDSELVSLRAQQASRRQQHIARLQDENGRMAREMDELRERLQPTGPHDKASEEEKEHTAH